MQLAYARKRKLGEFLPPGSLQMFAVSRRDREEQFVVFAVGDCVVDPAARIERQRLDVDLKAELAGFGEPREIGAKTVAQINHGMNRKIFCEPARFVDAREESQMFPARRAAEFSGDEKVIAGLSTAPRDNTRSALSKRRRFSLGKRTTAQSSPAPTSTSLRIDNDGSNCPRRRSSPSSRSFIAEIFPEKRGRRA